MAQAPRSLTSHGGAKYTFGHPPIQANDSEALAAARARADELEAAYGSYERRVRDLDQERAAAVARESSMAAELEALRQQVGRQAEELGDAIAQLQIAQAAAGANEDAETRVRDLEDEVERATAEVAMMRGRLEQLEARLRDAEKAHAEREAELRGEIDRVRQAAEAREVCCA